MGTIIGGGVIFQSNTALPSGVLLGANNGLNVDAGIAQLGGPLLENTSIDTTAAFSLSIVRGVSVRYQVLENSTLVGSNRFQFNMEGLGAGDGRMIFTHKPTGVTLMDFNAVFSQFGGFGGFNSGGGINLQNNNMAYLDSLGNIPFVARAAGIVVEGTPAFGSTGNVWAFGQRVLAASAFDNTRHLRVMVDGTVFKLAVCV